MSAGHTIQPNRNCSSFVVLIYDKIMFCGKGFGWLPGPGPGSGVNPKCTAIENSVARVSH